MYIQVLTTTSTKDEATKIADVLLDKKLAACAQIIGPIESHYTWQGKKEVASEYQLVIKTKQSAYAELEKTIKSLHSYEVPEIIALSIEQGSKEYLEWINGSVQ